MTNEIETPKRTRKVAVVGTPTVADKVARVRRPEPPPQQPKLAPNGIVLDESNCHILPNGDCIGGVTAGADPCICDPTSPPENYGPSKIRATYPAMALAAAAGALSGGFGVPFDSHTGFPKSHRRSRKLLPRGNRSLRVVDVIFGLESPASGVVTVILKDDRYDLTEAQLQHCDFRTKGRLASGVRAIIAANLKKVPGVTFNVKWDGK